MRNFCNNYTVLRARPQLLYGSVPSRHRGRLLRPLVLLYFPPGNPDVTMTADAQKALNIVSVLIGENPHRLYVVTFQPSTALPAILASVFVALEYPPARDCPTLAVQRPMLFSHQITANSNSGRAAARFPRLTPSAIASMAAAAASSLLLLLRPCPPFASFAFALASV